MIEFFQCNQQSTIGNIAGVVFYNKQVMYIPKKEYLPNIPLPLSTLVDMTTKNVMRDTMKVFSDYVDNYGIYDY